jgi:hypothetical protein
MFVSHRKQTHEPPRPVTWIALLFTYSPVHINKVHLHHPHVSRAAPRQESYLAEKTPGNEAHKLYWLQGRRSKASISNIFITYAIFKLFWSYEIQLWGKLSTSSIESLECFQSKHLRMIVDAPQYVPNTNIRTILQRATLKKKSTAIALSSVLASAFAQNT